MQKITLNTQFIIDDLKDRLCPFKDIHHFSKSPGLYAIGFIGDKSEGNNFITKEGVSHELIAQGWDSSGH